MDIIDIDPLAGTVQENQSNHLLVLLSKDMDIEEEKYTKQKELDSIELAKECAI